MPSIVVTVTWVDTMGTKAVYFLTASGEGGWQARKRRRSCDKKEKSRAVARNTFYPLATWSRIIWRSATKGF